MGEWRIRSKSDLKTYPHFDPIISPKEAEALATDPKRVATHKFYPFIRYNKHWTKFAKKGETGKPKDRPIRYAARRDAYIFSRYRHVLSEAYEAELVRMRLSGCVLAYRRIPTESGEGGKCNIHFARDAIFKVRELGNCCVLALDISGYFENLDHEKLKVLWCRMLGTQRLDRDHFRVFSAITKYAVVDKEAVYERLGHFGEKRKTKSGKPIKGYLTQFSKIPKQLCTGVEFRDKICGGNGEKSLIDKNFKPYGIPQGAPISDLLANLYLIDFDKIINERVSEAGGVYYRYSDDILIAIPGADAEGKKWLADIQSLIPKFGNKLVIKPEKSSVYVYRSDGTDQKFVRTHGTQGAHGLEYLGFRYDGKNVYLRDSTLSNLWRKVTFSARRNAIILARMKPDMNAEQLKAIFNYERLIKESGKVEDFDDKAKEYRSWTFLTYARRAAEIFGPLGKKILRQLKSHPALVRKKADKEIVRIIDLRRTEQS